MRERSNAETACPSFSHRDPELVPAVKVYINSRPQPLFLLPIIPTSTIQSNTLHKEYPSIKSSPIYHPTNSPTPTINMSGQFAGGKVDPVEAGKKGGQASGSSSGGASQTGGDKYKPTEHGGLKEDGTPDKRVQQDQFAHGKVDPVEAGKKGGQSS